MLHHRTSEHLTTEDAHLTSASMSSVSSHSLANSSSFFKMNCSSCTVPAKVTRESKRAVTPPRIPAKKVWEVEEQQRRKRRKKEEEENNLVLWIYSSHRPAKKKKLRYFFCLRFFLSHLYQMYARASCLVHAEKAVFLVNTAVATFCVFSL